MLRIRRLCLGILISNVGNGAWFTSWAIFLTRELPPPQVGLGMAIAAGLGLLAATPCGHLADRLGPRETLTPVLLVPAAGVGLYLAAGGFAGFRGAARPPPAGAAGAGGGGGGAGGGARRAG